MKRCLAIACAALGAAVIASAQVAVHVVDAGSGEAVPFAPVIWTIANGTGQHVVCDAEGRAVLLCGEADLRNGLVLSVAFLGYEPFTDTLYTSASVTVKLQRSTFALHEMVVTGQYAPNTAERAVHRVRVIDAEQMQRMAAESLGDVLRKELNIRMAQDNILGTSMDMQGLGGENVKVLVDGVPVIGRQNGDIDLAQIDLSGIERVEIVEGPLSVSYGTDALAGTINLITRKRSMASSTLKATAYAEHIGRLNLAATGTQRFGVHDLSLTIGRNFFGGWDPRQGGDAYDLSQHLADTSRVQQWKPREQVFARLGDRWTLNDRWTLGYKGEVMQDRITDRGSPRAPYGESAFDQQFLTQRLDNALFTEGSWGRGKHLNALVAHDRYRRIRNTWLRDLTTLDEELVTTPGMQDTSRFTLTNARVVFSSAPEGLDISYELGADLNLETGAGDRIGDGSGEDIGDYAAFASMEWKATPGVTLRPGVRAAYNTRYGAPITPSLNMRWQINSAITLRAGYARGFRAPSLKELYFLFVDVNHDITGNTDLDAESSHNFNAALGYRKPLEAGTVRAEVTGFYNRINDLITLAQIDGTRYSYVNIGDYRTTGGSLGAGWENDRWLLNIGGAVTGRFDALGEDSGGEAWIFSPEFNASVTREWKEQGWNASLFAKFQGELTSYVYLSATEVGRSTIDPFVMADVSVNKRIWNDRITIGGGCKNIANVTNLASTTGGEGVHDGAGGSVPMATGRTWFLRLDLEISKKSE